MSTPTEWSYKNAKETVEKYEQRQSELKHLEKELSFRVKQFSHVKFQVNKKEGEVLFTGLHTKTNKLVIGRSKCDKKDKFEAVIGKLIAVKKALKEEVEDVIKLVESNSSIVINTGGIFCGQTITSTGWHDGITVR